MCDASHIKTHIETHNETHFESGCDVCLNELNKFTFNDIDTDNECEEIEHDTVINNDKPKTHLNVSDSSEIIKIANAYWNSDPKYMGKDCVSPKLFPRCSIHYFFPNFAFLLTFANVTLIESSVGVIMIDCGHSSFATAIKKQVRHFSNKKVHSCIYTHGHIDHVLGILAFEELDNINVIAHENVIKHFDRYKLTNGYNTIINNKQFQTNNKFPSNFKYPNSTYSQSLKLNIGDIKLELYHGMGETDDATWVWFPDYRVICAGDFFIWASPNCGNPQKAQRYPIHWKETLDKMINLKPILLLPGHGPPIIGEDRVFEALNNTSEYLNLISQQTLDGINKGKRLSDIVSEISIPNYYKEIPYLQPVYDDPAFIVHNIWRHYAGWWDQNPAHLRVGNEIQVANEICNLVGGSVELSKKAMELCLNGNIDAATHFIEWSISIDPNNYEIHKIRSKIYKNRYDSETSLMAKGIYLSEHFKSEKMLGTPKYYVNKLESYVISVAEKKDALFELSIISYKIKSFFKKFIEYILIWRFILFIYSLIPEMPFTLVRRKYEK